MTSQTKSNQTSNASKRLLVSIVALFFVVSIAGCGGGGSDDGAPAPATPPVSGGNVNVINSILSGGTASVVAITAYDTSNAEKLGNVYSPNTLVGPCTNNWNNSGALCNSALPDDKATSSKTNTHTGSTWSVGTAGDTGVLIIDAGSAVSFSEARIFQMFSDGKTTHLRLAIHSTTSATPPAWNDAGWTIINTGDFVAIGAGGTTDAGLTVTDPTVIAVGSRTSRYVRVEARNDGTHGSHGYIELRAIKLF